jgi:hypothetical protein
VETPTATFDKRLSDLTHHVAELHTILNFAVERIRQMEASVGRDSHAIPRTEEWLQRMEHTFKKLLVEHNWHWSNAPDSPERRLGFMSHQQILRVGEMLPLDRCLALWQKYASHDVPVPRGWTDIRPLAESESLDPFEGRSDRSLVGQIKKQDKAEASRKDKGK